jgi:hypothetical protein
MLWPPILLYYVYKVGEYVYIVKDVTVELLLVHP